MSRMHATLLLLAAATSLPSAAHADTLDTVTFNFPAYTSPSPSPVINFPALDFTISVPASPVPLTNNSGCNPGGCFSFVADINGNPNVFDVTPYSVAFAPGNANNIPMNPLGYVVLHTPLLFSGSVTDPTFLAGSYDAGFAYAHPYPEITSPGTITITAPPTTTSPVPEPSTLTLLATGAFGLLSTLRRRTRSI